MPQGCPVIRIFRTKETHVITENGIVTKIDAKTAWVKTVRRSACEGCGSKESCEAAKSGHVEAVNLVGAGLGDAVTVGFESGSLIKISMLPGLLSGTPLRHG
jgi:sigma-E factor negative regulatory protein RseC